MSNISGLAWSERPHHRQTTLRCHCHLGNQALTFMTTILGYVRPKNDGRWEWFRTPTAYAPPSWQVTKYEQGIETSKEAALARVEEGLRPGDTPCAS